MHIYKASNFAITFLLRFCPSFVFYLIHSAFARSYKSRGHEPFMCEGGRYVNVECREGDV